MSRITFVERGFALRLSCDEPPYVVAVSRQGSAKVWLRPITLEYAAGLSRADASSLLDLVADRQMELLQVWTSLRQSAAPPRPGRRP